MRSTPPHILVVDHDEATRQLLGRMLQASGFTVESAARGREALERLGETLPDLVLLDVDLPDLPGDQVLEQIRARPEWASLAVVHVSAAPAGDDSGALDSGADAHLTLPIEALELSATLRAVLRARAAEQAGHHFARQWQKTFDAISDGVCLLDRAGLVQRCNRAFCELVAHPFHDVIGQRFAAVIEPALGCAALPVRDLSELRAGAVAECQSPVADGRWFRVAADPVLDDRRQLVGAVLIITEITQHKLVEQRIQQSNAELMQANRIKDEFLATLSHELRTPLNAIVGWTRLLRAGKLDADNAARALETIDRNATLQAKLIEDLLDVSRIITGKLRLRPASVDLVSIVEAGMSSVRPAADAKRIRLELRDDDGGVIFADGDRLQQVMWNLLSNAIKFTPEGGHVRIDIRRAGDAVEIRVSDDGRGISQAFLPFVFERFRQADSSTTRAHGGLGLGLAIVRHLVELHGGTVHADSDGDGRGATFTITLPARARARRNSVPAIPVDAVAQPLGDGVRLGGLSLLVVEDDPDSRELLAAALSQRGARVEACGSVEEALGKLDGGIDVDIIISDIGMPGEDGYALMARVRSLPPPVGDTPAIALTAYATADDVRRALAAGYQCHVCKPVDAPTLARVIRELAAIPAPVMTGDTQPILLAGKLDG